MAGWFQCEFLSFYPEEQPVHEIPAHQCGAYRTRCDPEYSTSSAYRLSSVEIRAGVPAQELFLLVLCHNNPVQRRINTHLPGRQVHRAAQFDFIINSSRRPERIQYAGCYELYAQPAKRAGGGCLHRWCRPHTGSDEGCSTGM